MKRCGPSTSVCREQGGERRAERGVTPRPQQDPARALACSWAVRGVPPGAFFSCPNPWLVQSGAHLPVEQAEGTGDKARVHEVRGGTWAGEQSDGATPAEGRAPTGSAPSPLHRQRAKGDKDTRRVFIKGALDEFMIFFFPASSFSVVAFCRCTEQKRDQG